MSRTAVLASPLPRTVQALNSWPLKSIKVEAGTSKLPSSRQRKVLCSKVSHQTTRSFLRVSYHLLSRKMVPLQSKISLTTKGRATSPLRTKSPLLPKTFTTEWVEYRRRSAHQSIRKMKMRMRRRKKALPNSRLSTSLDSKWWLRASLRRTSEKLQENYG
jgi:hypothetical protein